VELTTSPFLIMSRVGAVKSVSSFHRTTICTRFIGFLATRRGAVQDNLNRGSVWGESFQGMLPTVVKCALSGVAAYFMCTSHCCSIVIAPRPMANQHLGAVCISNWASYVQNGLLRLMNLYSSGDAITVRLQHENFANG
jgi:hypothetical protein